MMERESALRTGSNCWRVEKAHRSAFLVDGESYFRAFYEAVRRAEHSIWILGWDIDSRLELIRGAGPEEASDRPDQKRHIPALEGLLVGELERKKDLRVFVLAWDFAMVYAFERDLAPLFAGAWDGHERLHYHLDDHHPVGGSHHQKVVVVDDALAFVGGMDLTRNRWDTTEHRTHDPRRADADARAYSPFHDVQMAVDGAAARALGELARERWRTATGSVPPSPLRDPGQAGATDVDVWPGRLPVDVRDATIAIARTLPPYAYDAPREVREVEVLLRDLIATARDSLYIESQYLTSVSIGEALEQSLSEPEGPDVIAVLPRICSGWLEESTMGQRRNTLLRRLEEADRYGRFRAFSPVRAQPDGSDPVPIFVHSKVVIADDRYARVGSANLSNRSMGLDTECDLVLEANDPDTARAVRRLRARLLGEHLGVEPSSFDRALSEARSLSEAIDGFGSRERRLEPLVSEPPSSLLSDVALLADPEKPMEPELLLDELLTTEAQPPKRVFLRVGLGLLGAAVLAALWRWGPLGEWITLERLEAWEAALAASPLAFPGIVLAFVVGGLTMVPLTLLILATAASFDPWRALLYAVVGTLASGFLTFSAGKFLGRDFVRRAAGPRLNRMSRKLAKRGVLAIVAVRMIPVAPYGMVNLLAGATHIRVSDFLLGTFLGTLPGIVAITLLESRVEALVRDPSLGSASLVGFLVAALSGAAWWLRRRFGSNARFRATRS